MLDATQIRKAAQDVVAEIVGKKVLDGEYLISSGLIDSLSVLKLIGKLETRLAVTLPASGLQVDDFESVDFIMETVLRVARPR